MPADADAPYQAQPISAAVTVAAATAADDEVSATAHAAPVVLMAAPSERLPTAVADPVSAAVTTAAAPPPMATPPAPLKAFVLPTSELHELASVAGLEWVQSNEESVRSVQAAMAAEPKPVHQARVIKPVVLDDVGPLVLVETRKDLSQMKLPFEAAAH